MAQIIDGVLVASIVRQRAAELVARVRAAGLEPGLAVVLVGDDPGSLSYVRMKERDCAEVGIRSMDFRRSADITQDELEAIVDRNNADASVHGILVQLPLPKGFDEESVLERISPEKDADGLHPENLGRLVRGIRAARACIAVGSHGDAGPLRHRSGRQARGRCRPLDHRRQADGAHVARAKRHSHDLPQPHR
jgi:methylenetetrahydrofolate dehydrogenase (NADP+) / methenyltetrahydrofolate cyclohydrolase